MLAKKRNREQARSYSSNHREANKYGHLHQVHHVDRLLAGIYTRLGFKFRPDSHDARLRTIDENSLPFKGRVGVGMGS